MTPRTFLLRILILYAIAHIVALVYDIKELRESNLNPRYFWRNNSNFVIMLRIDIAILVIMLCANFIVTGNPFWIWKGGAE